MGNLGEDGITVGDIKRSGVLYAEYWLAEPGWQQFGIEVLDYWDVSNHPTINVVYHSKKEIFYLHLLFSGETYDKVGKIIIFVNEEHYMTVGELDLPVEHFFVFDAKKNMAKGSAEKCIAVINRYYNLRAFL